MTLFVCEHPSVFFKLLLFNYNSRATCLQHNKDPQIRKCVKYSILLYILHYLRNAPMQCRYLVYLSLLDKRFWAAICYSYRLLLTAELQRASLSNRRHMTHGCGGRSKSAEPSAAHTACLPLRSPPSPLGLSGVLKQRRKVRTRRRSERATDLVPFEAFRHEWLFSSAPTNVESCQWAAGEAASSSVKHIWTKSSWWKQVQRRDLFLLF